MAVSKTNSVQGSLTLPDVSHNSEAASSSFLDSNEYVDIHTYEEVSEFLHGSSMASKQRSHIKELQREITKNSTESEDLCCHDQKKVRYHPSHYHQQQAEKSPFKTNLKGKLCRPKSTIFRDSLLKATLTETRKEGRSLHAHHSIASAHTSQSPMAVKCSEPFKKEESKDHALEDTKPKLSWKRKDTHVVGVRLFQKMYHSLSTSKADSLPVKQKQRPAITVIINKESTCDSDLRTVPHLDIEKAIKQNLSVSDLHSNKEHHAACPSHGLKQAMSIKPSKEVLRTQYKRRPPPMIPPSTRNKEKYSSNFEKMYAFSSEGMHLSRLKFRDHKAQNPSTITHSFPKEDTHRNYCHNSPPSFNGELAEKGQQPTHDHPLLHSISCDALPTESSNGQYMSLTTARRKEVSSHYETLRPRT